MEQKTKNAEILCIGTELLMGDIVNTNAAYIARGLAALGINLYHQSVVGDNPARLKEALAIAFSRADIVITTGGLGPTYDDLSKETIAEYFGLPLVEHAQSLSWIVSYFKALGHEMKDNNKKQALMPKGAHVFHNQNGTAPGFAVEQGGKTAIMLPGPPREMEPMFDNLLVPYLTRFSNRHLVSKSLYFFGIGEAALESELHELMQNSENPTIAPYAKTGEVMLRVTARVKDERDAPALIEPVVNKIMQVAGKFLYGAAVGDLQTAVVRMLEEKGLTLAVAESCTGGLLAKRITDVSGASGVFGCGICSYSRKAKRELLGVKRETLEKFGAVSGETALEMAQGVKRLSGADIALSITGNAGPSGSEDKPVGRVHVAVLCDWYSEVLTLNIPRTDQDARDYIRTLASSHALNLAIKAAKMHEGA